MVQKGYVSLFCVVIRDVYVMLTSPSPAGPYAVQVFAEVHTHAHYYLVLAQNGSVIELPGLTNMDLASVQQVRR
jgi:hypothetical protein